ncbi:hypothetical protein OWR29_16615 [Actinoplanes sp. Pm04-4]|uniref:Uncharacterized protein n=1 Tax=Paractinoplanes pyxinae TaxID=2997416 RepID=A0ABT4AZF9_9ACTN|nr:hypothetical protein [Actinoplanes pyxinae]MCY1139624.1 hypothetical protein [Actinoplanes pyxinae]
MTERLDWSDPTLREWDCTVLWSDPADPEAGIVLDRSAFYPGGGVQRHTTACCSGRACRPGSSTPARATTARG